MKDTYVRICRLLAASGYREKELLEFIEQAMVAGPDSFLATVGELRRLEIEHSTLRILFDRPTETFAPPPSDAARKIERLLINDARMPRAVAIDALTEEVRRNFPSTYIPSESRKGFSNWIRRLAEVVPEKDLLFLATAIRNRVVHDAPGDWRLK
jgi:hypothetical protein